MQANFNPGDSWTWEPGHEALTVNKVAHSPRDHAAPLGQGRGALRDAVDGLMHKSVVWQTPEVTGGASESPLPPKTHQPSPRRPSGGGLFGLTVNKPPAIYVSRNTSFKMRQRQSVMDQQLPARRAAGRFSDPGPAGRQYGGGKSEPYPGEIRGQGLTDRFSMSCGISIEM